MRSPIRSSAAARVAASVRVTVRPGRLEATGAKEGAFGEEMSSAAAQRAVQVVSADLTRLFWHEPSDVSTARLGAVPASVLAWPSR